MALGYELMHRLLVALWPRVLDLAVFEFECKN